MPEFASYAPKLWRYWAEHLDPDRARRDDPAGPLVGKHVIITGASSGIGRAAAIAVAERGATVFALARNAEALDELIAEIRAAGGQAHAFTCDVTDSTSVEHTVKDILGRFDHVDYLVNNAGRSIRRSVVASTDRLHDYERVMAVNYFGAVRMVLALLPHWRERRFGHVVNVSSAGVQARNPKYSSYLPTKAALDAFSDVVSTETLSDHITFTNIHMPLVRTPMIAPSRRLNPVPPISAEHAAAMVVRGLVEKPARIDTPLGTLADFGNYLTPKLSRRVLHQLYLGYPDSAAARGETREPATPGAAPEAASPNGAVAEGSPAGQARRAVSARRALVGRSTERQDAVSHRPMTLPSVSLKYAANPISPTGIFSPTGSPPIDWIFLSAASMLSTSIVITGPWGKAGSRSNMPPPMYPGSTGIPVSVAGPVETIVYFISGISLSCQPKICL